MTEPAEHVESPEDIEDDAVIGHAFVTSVAVVAAVGVVALGAWWISRPRAVESGTETDLVDVREADEAKQQLPVVPFADVTTEVGIDFVHENGARGRKLLPETMGGGVTFYDYDADGDADLLFVNGRPWAGDSPRDGVPTFPGLVLYENDGTGTFTNVTERVGLADVDLYGMGATAGDHDGDGRLDLFVSCLGANRLLRFDGEHYEDVTEAAGLAGDEADWSTACGWFDFDRDGDLDLFVCNYLAWTAENDLTQDFSIRGAGRAYGRPANFGGTFCRLYENDGSGRFADVSERAGILVTNPATGVPMGKALGLLFVDFDEDGWLDVFVANDTVRNFLFHNRGDGTFHEVASLHGIAFDSDGVARGGMGTDVAPFRADGTIGVAIGNFAKEMTSLYCSRPGEMQFDDDANANGLGPATRLDLTFGTLFTDADLDGRLDLFSVNGHLEKDIALIESTQSYEQPPKLFWNAGAKADREFVALTEKELGEAFPMPLVGRGCAAADIDGDGDEDLVIATCGRAPRLLRNDRENDHHWLRLDFENTAAAIGARIDVTLEDGRVLRRQVTPTRSYLSQSDPGVLVGLGTSATVTSIEITPVGGEPVSLVPEGVDRRVVVAFEKNE